MLGINMTYLDELKEFSKLHAIAQDMPQDEFTRVLRRIERADGSGRGEWTYELSQVALSREERGDTRGAFEYYNLARFPFPRTAEMNAAHNSVVRLFDRFVQEGDVNIQKRVCHIKEASLAYYVHIGQPTGNVIFVCGGIVSIKEQWKALLKLGQKLKITVILAEMPGVGENTLKLNADSSSFISSILDDLSRDHPVQRAHCLTFSFSGTLAFRQVQVDKRIAAITTVGAPLSSFFLDKKCFQHSPEITRSTLLHGTGTEGEEFIKTMEGLALTPEDMQHITIPIYYVVSLRDEIIPLSDPKWLKTFVPHAKMIAFNDTHAAPSHFSEVRAFVLSSIMKEMVRKPFFRAIGGIKLWAMLRKYRYKA